MTDQQVESKKSLDSTVNKSLHKIKSQQAFGIRWGERFVIGLQIIWLYHMLMSKNYHSEALMLVSLSMLTLLAELLPSPKQIRDTFLYRMNNRDDLLVGLICIGYVISTKLVEQPVITTLTNAASVNAMYYQKMYWLWVYSDLCILIPLLLSGRSTLYFIYPSELPVFNVGLTVLLGSFSSWFGFECSYCVTGFLIMFNFLVYGLLFTYPKSFTLSEAVLIGQSLSLYFYDAIDATINITTPREDVQIVVQTLLLGMVLLTIGVYPITSKLRKLPKENKKLAIAFYGVIGFTGLCIMFPWLWFRLRVNPILWLLRFILIDTAHIVLVVYWIVCLVTCIGILLLIDTKNAVNTILRKYFHLIALLIFTPGMLLYPKFLSVSSAIALFLLITVENVRYGKVPPFGKEIYDWMASYLDEKDVGDIIVTHIYLLLGCLGPLWLDLGSKTTLNSLIPFAGILIIGIGDSAASIFGYMYGKHKWPGIKKSLEGTAAAILSVSFSSLALMFLLDCVPATFAEWTKTIISIILVCLLEAFTIQVDNLVLPLYFMSMLTLSKL